MKKSEIQVGGHYVAKVSGRLVTVRVDAIRPTSTIRAGKWADTFAYDVTNLSTGRKTTFRSAAKFRKAVDVISSETTTELITTYLPPKSAVPKGWALNDNKYHVLVGGEDVAQSDSFADCTNYLRTNHPRAEALIVNPEGEWPINAK